MENHRDNSWKAFVNLSHSFGGRNNIKGMQWDMDGLSEQAKLEFSVGKCER